MPTVLALRGVMCTCLGLGVLDLAVINAVLAPRIVEPVAPNLVAEARSAAPVEPDREPASKPANEQPSEPAREPASEPASKPMGEPADAATVAAPRTTSQVFFATRSARLDDATRRSLRDLVDHAGSRAGFVLSGHADHRGDESTNRDLSRLRAVAVATYLAELGVPSARVRIGYVGETEASEAGELWRDRRVDISTTMAVQ